MKLPLPLVFLLLFSGCSLPVGRDISPQFPAEDPARLMEIHIESWGSPRFTGLIGIRSHESGLEFILLDASGITLLAAHVNRDGTYAVTRAAGKLADTELPGFLVSALRKIFLIQPSETPCADNMLIHFCLEPTGDRNTNKSAWFGPFLLWKAEYDRSNPEHPTVMLSEPWSGVSLTLTDPQQRKL